MNDIERLEVKQELIQKEFESMYKIDQINADYYVRNYDSLMQKYLANGQPSQDTINTYFSNIRQFLKWCSQAQAAPLSLQEHHLMYYREWLISVKKYKPASIALKLTAVRKFYHVAMKFKLINTNPMADIRPHSDPSQDTLITRYLTAGQLEYLLRSIPHKESEEYFRDKLIIIMMALEGLRTIEIRRLSEEDINWELNTILIHGKGHNGIIYPREDTIAMLKEYLSIRTKPIKDPTISGGLTPVFTVVSNHNIYRRMSRKAIRDAVNYWLKRAEYKIDGISCHMLRHTCGTLLYAETKSLKVVQETLRHRNVEMSSKYAHLQNRMLNRYTNEIPVTFRDN